jgi:hypothetical protein
MIITLELFFTIILIETCEIARRILKHGIFSLQIAYIGPFTESVPIARNNDKFNVNRYYSVYFHSLLAARNFIQRKT